jgi:hypothetical protein
VVKFNHRIIACFEQKDDVEERQLKLRRKMTICRHEKCVKKLKEIVKSSGTAKMLSKDVRGGKYTFWFQGGGIRDVHGSKKLEKLPVKGLICFFLYIENLQKICNLMFSLLQRLVV